MLVCQYLRQYSMLVRHEGASHQRDMPPAVCLMVKPVGKPDALCGELGYVVKYLCVPVFIEGGAEFLPHNSKLPSFFKAPRKGISSLTAFHFGIHSITRSCAVNAHVSNALAFTSMNAARLAVSGTFLWRRRTPGY